MFLPSAKANNPPWTIVSYAYLSVSPNPIGVGQTADVCMWVDAPLPGAAIENDVRRHDYTLTITSPDGKIESKHWDVISDTTGVQFYQYVPDQIGKYTFSFNYPQQKYTWSGSYQNDTFLASNYTQTLTVQQDPISAAPDSYPLPTEYWSYPIEGQNTYWYTVASNWLGIPYIPGASAGNPGGEQPDGTAPNSAHIMWTKPIQYGGVAGGNYTNIPGEQFYTGLSYNARFGNPIIMQGILYYQEPYGNSGTGGPYLAVDLQTGQTLWSINASETGTSLVPSFGYLYTMDQPNQHGVLPNGLLVAVSGTTWRAYDPRTGTLTTMNVTNVPTGTAKPGPAGEYLKYVLTNYGTSTKPNWYLAQWNSSKVIGTMSGTGVGNWYSGTVNASLPSCYDWNVSVNLGGSPTGWSVGSTCNTIPLISLGKIALMIQGTFGGHPGDMSAVVTTNPANITAISLNPNTLGQTLWTQTYPQAPDNNTRFLSAWDPTNGVFTFWDKESLDLYGYSTATGNLLWTTSPPASSTVEWNYMGAQTVFPMFAMYGNVYFAGYGGLLYCWNVSTGVLQWTYGNGGEGNSTSSNLVTPYGHYPEFIEAVADGKIYLVGNEHSPNSPMYKDSLLRCINATDGTELWTIFGWGNQMSGTNGAVASGYLTVFNPYDGQIYCYGKGPSALTVTAPDVAAALGTPIVIKGTVTDIAAGTNQEEQAARFPNGVPVVSDSSQSAWMEYVYMQKPKPTDITGVPVTISVIDSNGNSRIIGTAKTTSSGTYSLSWTPDITGSYQVIATFAGTNSYWPSSSQNAFEVTQSEPTSSPYPVTTLPPIEMYIAAGVAAIIIAIALVGAVIVLMLKKRP